MKDQHIDAIVEELGAQLSRMRAVFNMALKYSRSEHPMRRLHDFFDPKTYGPEGLTPEPYAHFLPGVWVGFEGGKDVRLKLSATQSQLAISEDACDVEITRQGNDLSEWVTLEMSVPLQIVRPAQDIHVSIFGTQSGEEPDVPAKDPAMRLALFVYDTDKKRHDASYEVFRSGLEPKFGQARCDAKVAIPAQVRLDETRPANLVIFFSPAARHILLSDIHVAFN